jgi:hypothetical protein
MFFFFESESKIFIKPGIKIYILQPNPSYFYKQVYKTPVQLFNYQWRILGKTKKRR